MVGNTVRWLALAAVLALAGCSKGPYLDISGGSFIFNYRLSEAYAGLTAAPLRDLPAHSRIMATFQDPSGGPPIQIAKDVTAERNEYTFSTDPLKGIKIGKPYAVTVTLIASDGKTLETHDMKFVSDVDESILASKPLTIGPGYTRNPALGPNGG